MAKKNGVDVGRLLVMTLFVGLVAGLVAFVQGALLSLLASLGAGFVNVIQAVFGFVWILVGTVIRKGKENFGETMVALAGVGLVFTLLARLPVQIPLLTYAVEWSLEGFVLALGTVWMAEAFVRMGMKAMGMK